MQHKIFSWEHYRSFLKCDALRDLVPFAQFKKHEKTPLRSVTCTLIKGKWLKYKRYEME